LQTKTFLKAVVKRYVICYWLYMPLNFNKLITDYFSGTIAGTISSTQSPEPIPEPTTIVLLSLGCAGLIAFRRKKAK
jgi:hypothetical protein